MAETDICKFSGSLPALGSGNTPAHEHGHTHEHLEHAGKKEISLPASPDASCQGNTASEISQITVTVTSTNEASQSV